MDMESLVRDIGIALLGVGLVAIAHAKENEDLREPRRRSKRTQGILSVSLLIMISLPDSHFWSSLPGTLLLVVGFAALWGRQAVRGKSDQRGAPIEGAA
jgi:hypothetical protein